MMRLIMLVGIMLISVTLFGCAHRSVDQSTWAYKYYQYRGPSYEERWGHGLDTVPAKIPSYQPVRITRIVHGVLYQGFLDTVVIWPGDDCWTLIKNGWKNIYYKEDGWDVQIVRPE